MNDDEEEKEVWVEVRRSKVWKLTNSLRWNNGILQQQWKLKVVKALEGYENQVNRNFPEYEWRNVPNAYSQG